LALVVCLGAMQSRMERTSRFDVAQTSVCIERLAITD
jgi:hypothetical protein